MSSEQPDPDNDSVSESSDSSSVNSVSETKVNNNNSTFGKSDRAPEISNINGEAANSHSLSDLDEDEELQQLAEGEAYEVSETPADVMFANTKKQEEEILSLIEMAKSRSSSSIDLSKKNLQSFPDEILLLNHVEVCSLHCLFVVSLAI